MFKSLLAAGAFAAVSLLTSAAPALAQTSAGVVDCDNGAEITNGVTITVNMRPGFTYTATVIGLGDFDPVLAVLDESGTGLCEDDTREAADYEAYLPTSDGVEDSRLSAQVPFTLNNRNNEFGNISLVVGDYSGSAGEFVLIIEGMAVTAQDGSGALAGDPFYVSLTENVLESGVPINVYMISRTNTLDPMIRLVDADSEDVLVCDDAGTDSCETDSVELDGYWISQRDGELGGYEYDAMMSIPLEDIVLNDESEESFFEFRMTSYNQTTYGEYSVAFHLGTAATNEAAGSKD